MDTLFNFYVAVFSITVLVACTAAFKHGGHISKDPQIHEYCEDQMFTAKCAENEAIFLQSAMYGRMRKGQCITNDYGHIGCSVNVLHQLDQWCSGKQKCEVMVSNLVHGVKENPCPKDFRSYLEASYICIPVVQSTTDGCYGRTPVLITGPVGYISSQVTKETGCGSIDNPWTLQVRPGQKISIYLLDFSLALFDKVKASHIPKDKSSAEVCSVYAIVKEAGASNTQTICGGQTRVRRVYSSQGNKVEARIVTKRAKDVSSVFVLKYEAIGCADPTLSSNTVLNRPNDGNAASVSCKDGTEMYKITCQDNKWHGNYHNCSLDLAAASTGGAVGVRQSQSGKVPSSLSIVIVVAVALMVGIMVLAVGIICLKRHHQRRQQPTDISNKDIYHGTNVDTNYKVMDAYGGTNDYYRTWQVSSSKDGSKSTRSESIPPPPYQPNSNCTCEEDERYVEHVYESPKFDRHTIHSADDINQRASYFELDQDAVRRIQNSNAHGQI